MARFRPGTGLFGKYRIERLLGRGGFAEVYLATHLHLDTPRALKVLTKGRGVTTEVLNKVARRFHLEARLGAHFAKEPHIVRVYDFEWDREAGLLCLVMEYLPGGSLKDRIAQARREGLPGLPVAFVVQTAYHAALGLAALHRADLVHRDVKPSNILYDEVGNAKIADLGVVQVPHGLTQRTVLGPQAPRHPGTPEYMSPEQATTRDYLPPASDVYSLGVTLFEALTLRQYKHLRSGTRVRQLRPEVPTWLDDLIARMLAKDPEVRPWDGEELARLLKPYVEAASAEETSPTFSTRWSEDEEATQVVTEAVRPAPQPASVLPPVEKQDTAPPREKRSRPRTPSTPRGRGLPVGWLVGLLGLLVALLLTLGWGAVQMTRGRLQPDKTAGAATIPGGSTLISSLAPTPTPFVGPVLMGTPYPMPAESISPENAAKVTQLARWGKGTVSQVDFSPDGRLLAVASSLGVYIYDVQTLEQRAFWETSAWVNSVAFSPDGRLLASGLSDGTVHLWRVADGTLLRTVAEHKYGVSSVDFSPGGGILASGSWDGTVRLSRVADGALLHTLEGHTEVLSVDFSPDGRLLASGASDGAVRLWKVADGTLLRTLAGHTAMVLSVVFSPNGKFWASGLWDGTVRLWRVDGTSLHILKGHTRPVFSAAFSPDGALLASGSGDNTVRLWRVPDGTLLHILEGHTDWVRSVTFSPDGRLLAAGLDDGTIVLWGIVP